MELTDAVKALKGSACRMFMVQMVQALGPGGQRLAERELGWYRGTIRKSIGPAPMEVN